MSTWTKRGRDAISLALWYCLIGLAFGMSAGFAFTRFPFQCNESVPTINFTALVERIERVEKKAECCRENRQQIEALQEIGLCISNQLAELVAAENRQQVVLVDIGHKIGEWKPIVVDQKPCQCKANSTGLLPAAPPAKLKASCQRKCCPNGGCKK